MHSSDVFKGSRENQGQRLWGQETRKRLSAIVWALYDLATAGSQADMQLPWPQKTGSGLGDIKGIQTEVNGWAGFERPPV